MDFVQEAEPIGEVKLSLAKADWIQNHYPAPFSGFDKSNPEKGAGCSLLQANRASQFAELIACLLGQ